MSQYHPYEVPIRTPILDAHIKFVFQDKNGLTERTFESVQRLAEFLRYNESLGAMVGYVPKKNEWVDFNTLIMICDLIYHSFNHDHTTYVSTANTKKLNAFFRDDERNVYSLSHAGAGSIFIESPKVLMVYTHSIDPSERKLTIDFKLKDKFNNVR